MFSRTYTLRAISAAAIILLVSILAAHSNTVRGTTFISPTDMAAEWGPAISDPITVNKRDFDQLEVAAMPMVLSGEALTFMPSGAEGMLAAPASDPVFGDLGSTFTINYQMGSFLPFGTSSLGAVWNMSNPDHDSCADSFYFFQLGGSSIGFELGKQMSLHDPIIPIAWDSSVSLKPLTIYDVTIRRAGKNQNVTISEQGGAEIVNVSFMDDMFNTGSFGHYADNLFKAEWGTTHFSPISEPQSFALAGMDMLGVMIFLFGKRRRTVDLSI